MPEIPDLEAISGFLNAQLAGRKVEEVTVRYPWLVRSVDGLDVLVEQQFESVRRYGKFLILE
jgi:formamidopyrimidine-DNA glycosylase